MPFRQQPVVLLNIGLVDKEPAAAPVDLGDIDQELLAGTVIAPGDAGAAAAFPDHQGGPLNGVLARVDLQSIYPGDLRDPGSDELLISDARRYFLRNITQVNHSPPPAIYIDLMI